MGAVALCCTSHFTGSFADELPFAADLSNETVYRRIFVPADSPEKWPVGSARYLPIAAPNFASLIQQARGNSSSARTVPAQFSGAIYRAELLQDDMLAGTAEIAVKLPDAQARLLPLAPLNLAITSAVWQRNASQPAALGLWKHESLDDPLGVLVKQSDTLLLDWQLRAQSTQASNVEFLLKIPTAVPQTFELVLPSNQTALLKPGELIRTQPEPSGKLRWLFQLAPSPSYQLNITKQAPQSSRQTLPRVSQTTSYQLEPDGLAFETTLRLDARETTASRLSLSLSGEAKIVSVLLDQKAVLWGTEVGSKGPILVVPRPPAQAPQQIEIHGIAQLRSNKSWQLPTIRARDVFWTEGTVGLLVSPSLELRGLAPQEATLQHIVGLHEKDTTGEAYRLQEWSEEASLEIIVDRRKSRLKARTSVVADLGPNQSTIHAVAMVSSKGRETFHLKARVAPEWSVESVKATPARALRGWHIERNNDQSLIHVQLHQPILSNKPLRLQFDGQAATGKSLLPATVGQWKLLRFLDTDTERQLLLIRNRERGQMELLHGLESARLSVDTLEADDADLLPAPVEGTLLDLTGLSEEAIVQLQPRPARYHAEVNVQLNVLPQTFLHHYWLDCQPTTGVVSELIVHFDHVLPDYTQWELVGHPGTVVVQRIGEPSATDVDEEQGVAYRLRLPIAMDKPFRLETEYSVPAKESERCNGIRLPEAATWQGQIVIRGPLDGLRIDDRGWSPAGWPADEPEEGVSLPILGCYRLDAAGAGQNRRAPALVVHKTSPDASTASVVGWLAEYSTLQAANGTAIHVAGYYLENTGATGAEIVLPQQSELQEAWINQQQLNPRNILADDRTCRFHFADQQRYLTMVVKYVTHGPSLGRSAKIQPSLPKCSFPVRQRRWTLWTPEQYVLEESLKGNGTEQIRWWERLFGPLARAPGEPLFHPFQSSDWPRLWSLPMEGHRTKRSAEKLARKLNAELAEGSGQSWAQLLHTVASDLGLGNLVLVDRFALHAQDIQASTASTTAEVAESKDRDGLATNASQLPSRGLALVAGPKMIVVTSAERVAHWYNQLQPTAIPSVFSVASQKLASRLQKLATSPSGEIVSVAAWETSSELSTSPWRPLSFASLADVGRSACTLDFSSSPPVVLVRRAYLQQSLWYAVWLLAVVLGSWRLAHHIEQLVLALAIAGAVCLVVPPAWLTVPQAVWMGLLAAVLVRAVFGEFSIPIAKQESMSTVLRTAVAVVLAWCVLAYGLAHAVPVAGDVKGTTTSTEQELHRVLVPIDRQGNRQGDDVYVPETFLDTLQKIPQDSAHDNSQYSISSAVYRGGLRVDPQSKQVEADPWTFTIVIESFLPDCVLRLPFQKNEAEWLENLHRFDGISVQLEWNSDGNGCTLNLGDVGVHRLELSAQPNITSSTRSTELRMHVPRVPGALLDLTVPAMIDDLQIGAAGQIHVDPAGNRWRTVLSPTDTLQLNWTPSQRTDLPDLVENVEQLSWLHVEPSVARLDVQLHLLATSEVPRTLQLETSPHLKPLPVEENSPVDAMERLPEDPNIWKLILKPGLDQQVHIPLQFQLQRNLSLGRLSFPQVRLKGITTSRSLFAVSVSSGLSYDESLTGDVRSIAVTEFASQWGTTEIEPLYAYSLGDEHPDWSLRVWPDPNSFTARQTMRVNCQRGSVHVDYEAAVDNVAGNWLIHRLKVSPHLRLQTVSVTSQPEKEAVPLRWNRVNRSEVIIFLGQPLKGPHTVSLEGHLEPSAGDEFSLPSVALRDANRDEIYVDLYRDADVVVNWTDGAPTPVDSQQPRKTQENTDVFVGKYAWRVSKTKTLGKIRIKKNNPQFTAETVTTLEHSPQGWSATLHARVHVLEGVVSHLIVAAPGFYREPYQVQPASLGVVGKVDAAADGREITILLSQPIHAGDTIEVHLTSSLDLPGDQRLEVPQLRLAHAKRSKRYVLLPTRMDQRSIEWQRTVGLKRETLPQHLAPLVEPEEHALPFLVELDQFSAQERSYQGPLRNAAVRYAMISGSLDVQGSLTATAELVLQPGRASHCTVRLPPHSQLTQLVANDQPMRRERVDPRSWRIPLGPPFMPHRIMVAYIAKADVIDSRLELAPPEILIGDQQLPLPPTYWKIRPLGGLQFKAPSIGSQVEKENFAETAYRLSLQTLEDASTLALELPIQEGRSWFRSWKQHTRSAWDHWQSTETWTGTAVDSSRLPDNTTIEETSPSVWTMLENELGDSTSDQEDATVRTYPPRLPVRLSASTADEALFFASNSQGQLVLRLSSTTALNIWQWFIAVVIPLSGLALALLLRRKPDWSDQFWRHPHIMALIVGLAWWMLLKPSAVGLLLVALTAVALLGRRWRTLRQYDQHDTSTQIVTRAL